MRVLHLPAGASPRERGRVHGEAFRHDIRMLAAIRLHLATRIAGVAAERLLELAAEHLPILARYDHDASEELLGIAEGAGLGAAETVVLNHYTDLRDLGSRSARADFDGGCTMVYARTASGPILAQTWDMHATASPYVIMLRVPDGPGGGAWVLSLTGCLALCGLSRSRVAVGINNLTSTDARTGLVWPALIRCVLRDGSAELARDRILAAPLGSGHHYLVADRNSVFGIETSGGLRVQIYAGESDSYAHSNHCLDPAVAARSRVPTTSTTRSRLEAMTRSLQNEPIRDLEDAWRRLGDTQGFPHSICTNVSTPENPHGSATCAGIAMDIERGVVLAAAGQTHGAVPQRFEVDG